MRVLRASSIRPALTETFASLLKMPGTAVAGGSPRDMLRRHRGIGPELRSIARAEATAYSYRFAPASAVRTSVLPLRGRACKREAGRTDTVCPRCAGRSPESGDIPALPDPVCRLDATPSFSSIGPRSSASRVSSTIANRLIHSRFDVPFYRSRNARDMLSSIGFMMYWKNVRSLVLMKTSAGMPGVGLKPWIAATSEL